MNPLAVLKLAMTLYSLNKGQSAVAKVTLREGIDVVHAIGDALKDKKITAVEKDKIVRELKEFSDSAISLIDDITLK